jgi:hypothetical protein
MVAAVAGSSGTVPRGVAQTHARLSSRGRFTSEHDVLFPNEAGEHIDGSAVRRQYVRALKRAGLRPLRFHDLRHTFGSLAVNRASIGPVQAWMDHADGDTTMRYLHHKSRADDAKLLADAVDERQSHCGGRVGVSPAAGLEFASGRRAARIRSRRKIKPGFHAHALELLPMKLYVAQAIDGPLEGSTDLTVERRDDGWPTQKIWTTGIGYHRYEFTGKLTSEGQPIYRLAR